MDFLLFILIVFNVLILLSAFGVFGEIVKLQKQIENILKRLEKL